MDRREAEIRHFGHALSPDFMMSKSSRMTIGIFCQPSNQNSRLEWRMNKTSTTFFRCLRGTIEILNNDLLEKGLERNCILNSFNKTPISVDVDKNHQQRQQKRNLNQSSQKNNHTSFHNMRYYYPLASAALSAFALLSPTTESFAPRSLTSATSKPSQTSLFVSVSPDSLDGTKPQLTSVAAVPKVAQRWRKSTKQLATLGPASSNFEMIEKVRIFCSTAIFV